jgi:hypothetical protein
MNSAELATFVDIWMMVVLNSRIPKFYRYVVTFRLLEYPPAS